MAVLKHIFDIYASSCFKPKVVWQGSDYVWEEGLYATARPLKRSRFFVLTAPSLHFNFILIVKAYATIPLEPLHVCSA